VVESRHQFGVGRHQHAVAEDVTGHVADSHAGEVLGRRIDSEFTEVPSHRDPGTTRGDAHLLVVKAFRASRGEGIAQPVPSIDGDLIGQIAEGRGALVGGHHQIRVVVVPGQDVVRTHHGAVHDVVGDRQQGGDERRVARPGFRDASGRLEPGEPQRIEATLGADRHDDGILHCLSLDQIHHLGAIVLGPIGPTDTATGDLAEAQMNAFDLRRVNEDLVGRLGTAHELQPPWFDLHGESSTARTCPGSLGRVVQGIEVGAHHRRDDAQVLAEHAVLVQHRDRIDGPAHLLGQFRDAGFAIYLGVLPRRELGLEQLDQRRGDRQVLVQRLGDVRL